jgi:osmotically-inducible protein OsmY
MADYNRSDRYRNDNRSSYDDRNYDMNWDRNYNTGDEYRGYNNGNRNVYSSDRERDYWNNRNRNYNDYNDINRDSYANRYDRSYNTGGYPDYRNQRYNDYNRNYTNDYNSSNDFYRNDRYNRFNDRNDNYMGRPYSYAEPYTYNNYKDRYSDYNDRYNNYNDRYRNERWRDDDWNNDYRNNDRGWWDKTKDEVASWFGDDEAERRRRRDEMRNGQHRGKGPKNYTRSEERIREDVSDALTDDSFLDASGIEVNVKDGDVTLNGHVDSRYSKHRAEDLAEDVTGVKNVQNNLRVKEDVDNTIDKTSVNNGNKSITSNTSYNTTKNKKETSNA